MAHVILWSRAGCIGFSVCFMWAKKCGEVKVAQLPSFLPRPLWSTCPYIFPGEFEIHGHPESFASLITLCPNPSRTGTHFCHPVVSSNALQAAWPKAHNRYLLTSPKSDTGSKPRPAFSSPVMAPHDDFYMVDDKIQGHVLGGGKLLGETTWLNFERKIRSPSNSCPGQLPFLEHCRVRRPQPPIN